MTVFCKRLRGLWPSLRLAALGLLSMPAIALAHGTQIQARMTSAVEIQATYDNQAPMAGAQVQVFSPSDPQTPVMTGSTDEEGKFRFTPDQDGNWEVAVRQAGHGSIAVIPVSLDGTIADNLAPSPGLTGLQRGIVAGAVTWGCVGTALYFRRGKQ